MPLPVFAAGGLWTAFWTFLASTAPWLVKKVLIALGFGFVVFSGVSLAVDQLESWIFSQFTNLGSDLFAILVLADLDTGIAILFAGMAARLSIQTTIATKKMVLTA